MENPFVLKMTSRVAIAFLLCINFLSDFINADPGRDQCKIINGSGLRCTKISSHLFPYDTFLSFNDDVAHFTVEMKYLEIDNSNISVLQSRSFQRTPYLSHIILRNIFLIEIEPGAFEGLKRLKLLDLSDNLLQTIPVDAFKYTKITRLNLNGNALLDVPSDGPFLNAKYLTSLSLKSCNIQQLPGSAFQQTPALMHLDLSLNYLKTLPWDIFAPLQHLTLVDLSQNEFRKLDVNVFQSIPSFPKLPSSVILSGNPWVCDCKIAKLGDWVARNVKNGEWSEKPGLSRLKKMVECQQPQRMSWNDLKFKELISSC